MQESFDITGFDHYAEILQSELERRQQVNKSFSLRAFAKALAVSPSTLSEIIRKKHGISRQLAEKFTERLGYEEINRGYFLNLFDFIHSPDVKIRDGAYTKIQEYRTRRKHHQIQDREFSMVSHWYNLAIIELVKMNQFKFDYDWIAEQLGISTLEAMSAISRLKQAGLLQVKNGKIEPVAKAFISDQSMNADATRRFFIQYLEKAIDSVKYHDIHDCFVGLGIVAIDEEDIPKLHEKMKAFKNDLSRQLASKKNKTKLYCIGGLAFDVIAAVKGKKEANQRLH